MPDRTVCLAELGNGVGKRRFVGDIGHDGGTFGPVLIELPDDIIRVFLDVGNDGNAPAGLGGGQRHKCSDSAPGAADDQARPSRQLYADAHPNSSASSMPISLGLRWWSGPRWEKDPGSRRMASSHARRWS
jgi:hypothetical protein